MTASSKLTALLKPKATASLAGFERRQRSRLPELHRLVPEHTTAVSLLDRLLHHAPT